MSASIAEQSKSPLWAEDLEPLSLPQLQGEASADVCVVGLGGSGLSCIAELRRAGASVVGIDADVVAGGAAGRNGGFLLAGLAAFHHEAVRVHGRERAARAYRLTLAELDRISAETPDAVSLGGSLRIAANEQELADCRAQLAAMYADQLPVEWYIGPEGEGLLFPRDGTFNPLHRCRSLARHVLAAGAALHERSPAVRIERGRVATPDGAVRAGAVIVAVDGCLEQLLPELEGRVRTARLQMLGTAPAPEVRYPRPVYMRWGLDYWQQRPDGRIALGGFRDAGGDSEWTTAAELSAIIQERLEQFLRQRLRVTAPVTHRWAATVGYTATGLPIVDEVRPGVWATGGYCGTGNVVGAVCGRALAELVTKGATDLRI